MANEAILTERRRNPDGSVLVRFLTPDGRRGQVRLAPDVAGTDAEAAAIEAAAVALPPQKLPRR